MRKKVVPPARLELALPKKPDFESGASTNSATGATEVIEAEYIELQISCQAFYFGAAQDS